MEPNLQLAGNVLEYLMREAFFFSRSLFDLRGHRGRGVWQDPGQDAVSGHIPFQIDLQLSCLKEVPFFQQYENSEPPVLPAPDHPVRGSRPAARGPGCGPF